MKKNLTFKINSATPDIIILTKLIIKFLKIKFLFLQKKKWLKTNINIPLILINCLITLTKIQFYFILTYFIMLKSSIENDDANELDPITQACLKVYPDQINVLQAVSKIQYWQNGPDPLDFISIYINNDSLNNRANPYFHYVSLGLSDLYGDERVFKNSKSKEEQSGYGFELTMKVKMNLPYDIKNPPTWPFKLMQCIARYIYNGGNYTVVPCQVL